MNVSIDLMFAVILIATNLQESASNADRYICNGDEGFQMLKVI
jgi:hypothetical protein